MVLHEIVIIIVLMVFNGLLAAAEMSIVASRKTKLESLFKSGKKKAKLVMDIKDSPDDFLSTIQIGITMIGLITGLYSGKTVATGLATLFENAGLNSTISLDIAFVLVIIIVTYFTLIIGELVPKRIAILFPEKLSMLLITPMKLLKKLLLVFVRILSISTRFIIKILRLKNETNNLSEEEIKSILMEGKNTGIIDNLEKELFDKVFLFNDILAGEIMIDINDVIWIDIKDDINIIKSKIVKGLHSYYPLCEDSIDNIIGLVNSKTLILNIFSNEKLNLKKFVGNVNKFNLKTNVQEILNTFKKSNIYCGFIYNEYNIIRGFISLNNIIDILVGKQFGIDKQNIIETGINEYIVNGSTPIFEIKQNFGIEDYISERKEYFTLSGLIMDKMGKIPVINDEVMIGNYKFQVIDMTGNKINKIKISDL